MPHTPVTGYSELSESELTAMNKFKALENEIGEFVKFVEQMEGVDQRCLALGRTNLQQGFMWAIRSIAKPTSKL